MYADVDSVQKPFKIAHHQPGFNISNLSSSNNSSKSESEDNFCNEEESNMANIFDKQYLETLIKELQAKRETLGQKFDVKVKHTTERDKPIRKYFEFKSFMLSVMMLIH